MTQKLLLKPNAKNSEFYYKRLNSCLEEAKDASLPLVRERSMRAATAWKEMYDKARMFELRLIS